MGIRIVKAFNRQQEENRKFITRAKALYDFQIKVAHIRALNMAIMTFLVVAPVGLILWYGGRQVVDGNLSIGDVSAFVMYLGMLNMPIRRIGFIATMLSRTMSAGQRIVEIFDTESAVQEKPGAIQLEDVKGAVTFEDVTFSYDSAANTLEDISFTVEPGQTVALLGGSGSGKSTISSLLSRFYDVKNGRILIDGIDTRDVTLSSLRKNVVAAQQDIFLFSDTIHNNIAYGDVDATTEQIETVAKAARLHDFVASLPDGYETWVGERGFTLSGGERQRLAIARTLLLNPKVLILDDSTSSVDAQTEHLIRQALDKLIQGRTTFIITHRLPIIKNADLILMLKDGKIIERGKHVDLMAMKGLYYSTYQAQLMAEKGLEEKQKEE
jgi:ATP-binding cassette subfamily B protein